MNRFLPALIALPIAGLTATAHATTVLPLSLQEQAKRAEIIVHARISAVSDETRGDLPWRVYVLDVKEIIAGDPKELPQVSGAPSFAILGGNLSGQNVTLEGAPVLSAESEYILMLYKTPYDNPIVGFNQGVYFIQNGRVSPLRDNPTRIENNELAPFKQRLVELRGTP
ncbi:hypothetical protein HNR42_000181 [Deinobacterium chartae]|uniref:Uncharacterized protein n=1 Tax=Deinobacterium chartae TaxID=521158 RepID=A0A841HWZ7_9DEIO|nr:hypothetical protein [Deinobacterium chartae]MBB6096769.1 hypothetical protein [Deinobacterium chartae]